MAESKRYGVTGIGTDVELGKQGTRIINNSGAVELKDKDGNFVVGRGAAPVAENDFVTKKYLETKADVTVSGQIDGANPPAAVPGAVYVVTTTGGTYTAGELYYGITGPTWEAITVPDGLKIVVTVALTGGTLEFAADTLYVWDAGTSAWLKIGPAPEAVTGVEKTERASLVFGTPGVIPVGSPVAINGIVIGVIVNVSVAFDGDTPATLIIGDVGDTDRLMTNAEVDLSKVGRYLVDPYYLYASATQVNATLGVGANPSAGAAQIIVQWSKA